MHSSVVSPKRPARESGGLSDLYPYYAGFSFEWALGVLETHCPPKALVLDPWNGCGTTTTAAAYQGRSSVGLDINQVVLNIAKLRVLSGARPDSLKDRPKSDRKRDRVCADPLIRWFDHESTIAFRSWSNLAKSRPIVERLVLELAIIRTARSVTSKAIGSNPTWVRRSDDQVSCSATEIDASINLNYADIAERISQVERPDVTPQLIRGSSVALPLADESVDFVLTSPPYLTRIDYTVLLSRELALLGSTESAQTLLRKSSMGTTAIRAPDLARPEFGSRISRVLEAVAAHPSKASGGYYLKQKLQYFTDLVRSVAEIHRTARLGAKAVVVVQDSTYKDVHIPLGGIVVDEFARLGWALNRLEEHSVQRSLVSLNSKSRVYGNVAVNENVIHIQKVETSGR
jgi:hypothetical protein